MKRICLLLCICVTLQTSAQADNEIQVYASPTIGKKRTIVELHSNYTFKGPDYLSNPKLARWLNETLEITTGLGSNVELGFYTFTAAAPMGGGYQYLGNQIRPRVTAPDRWKVPVGLSLSAEFGFFRPHTDSSFIWQGEIRPIVDKTAGAWYFSLNPNIDFVLTGDVKGWGFAPQFKTVYTIKRKLGVGFEYYGGLGNFGNFLPGNKQEHLIGPVIDLYTNPDVEVNAGFLFGLTPGSNRQVFKLLLGRRFGK
jgi:hypothetical protein